MINNFLILVCNEGELELAYETVKQLGNQNVAVVSISDLKDEIELLNAIRHYVPIHFIHLEPNYVFSKESIIQEEFKDYHKIGIVGHIEGMRSPSGVDIPKLTIDELVSIQMNETREHTLALREDLNYFFFEEKDIHHPWKNARNVPFVNFKNSYKGKQIKTHRVRNHRMKVKNDH